VNQVEGMFEVSIDSALADKAVNDAALGFCLTHMQALGLTLPDVSGCVESVFDFVNSVLYPDAGEHNVDVEG
jgi:hypothetical protein